MIYRGIVPFVIMQLIVVRLAQERLKQRDIVILVARDHDNALDLPDVSKASVEALPLSPWP